MTQIDDLFNIACQQLSKKIKKGEFTAADINAAVNLIKAAEVEISFDNNEDVQDLNSALNDSESGEEYDLSKPPEYKPELEVVKSSSIG